MEPVNVLVVSSTSEQALRMIADVSPRIKIFDSSKLWDAPDIVTKERAGDFSNKEFDAMLSQAEVVYGFRLPEKYLHQSAKTKMVSVLFCGSRFYSE